MEYISASKFFLPDLKEKYPGIKLINNDIYFVSGTLCCTNQECYNSYFDVEDFDMLKLESLIKRRFLK